MLQNQAPLWLDPAWRDVQHPLEQSYSSFLEADAAESLDELKRSAVYKMAEQITVDIKVSTANETKTNFIQRVEEGLLTKSETVDKKFTQTGIAATKAQISGARVESYYSPQTRRIYAFATVNRKDLADYYSARIEFSLDEAQRGLEHSKQLAALDKRKEALEKLDGGRKLIDSTAYYRALLITVDTRNGLRRSQGERESELLKEIAAARAEIEGNAKTLFQRSPKGCDIIIPGLQTILSENNVTVAENEKEAAYILKIDAKACNLRSDEHFHYASACVKVTLTNVRTGKNEITITVNGRKEGGLNERNAGERAFKSAIAEIWTKIKPKILEVNS